MDYGPCVFIDLDDVKQSEGRYEALGGKTVNKRCPRSPKEKADVCRELSKCITRNGKTGLVLSFVDINDLFERAAVLGKSSVKYMVVDVIGTPFRTFEILQEEVRLEPVYYKGDVYILWDGEIPEDRVVHETGPIRLPGRFPLRRDST
ncbi:hypothetical protein BFJ66_g11164 [Fusarium oxysporum f. sp. cepae]|uniref:Uncharacterized protein n=1 Tax=Fusarium oxysporum f. sp. cepae TaxID=396571 RepID=A0A3L6NKI2_FUSOX|nr:hypothetical protein BFJ65_g8302 [Fusarium oxysporum f. sp. cepae]RKK39219.1 hypothetical protein BFJ67_g11523 [Fusarium oxysporum f. sp. cepae]RKK41134.1 hypothetical protein BFJ66_g11164 [Fusarium oxysporum f. sp. cepae]